MPQDGNVRVGVFPEIEEIAIGSLRPGGIARLRVSAATEVTFGGVKATTFKVISGGEVTADVPTGAETGVIAITTAGGTATSSQTFTVTE